MLYRLLNILKSIKTLRALIFIFAIVCFIALIAVSGAGLVGEHQVRLFLFGTAFVIIYSVLGFFVDGDPGS